MNNSFKEDFEREYSKNNYYFHDIEISTLVLHTKGTTKLSLKKNSKELTFKKIKQKKSIEKETDSKLKKSDLLINKNKETLNLERQESKFKNSNLKKRKKLR